MHLKKAQIREGSIESNCYSQNKSRLYTSNSWEKTSSPEEEGRRKELPTIENKYQQQEIKSIYRQG